MNPREDLIFWAKRWVVASRMFKKIHHPAFSVPDLAEMNYGLYLSEVFSYLFERRLECKKNVGDR